MCVYARFMWPYIRDVHVSEILLQVNRSVIFSFPELCSTGWCKGSLISVKPQIYFSLWLTSQFQVASVVSGFHVAKISRVTHTSRAPPRAFVCTGTSEWPCISDSLTLVWSQCSIHGQFVTLVTVSGQFLHAGRVAPCLSLRLDRLWDPPSLVSDWYRGTIHGDEAESAWS
jgi:hypothetical protein